MRVCRSAMRSRWRRQRAGVRRGQAYHCASEAGDVLADTLMKELQRDMADAEGALLRQRQQQQQGAHERPQVGAGALRAAASGGRSLRRVCCVPACKRALRCKRAPATHC